MKLNQKIKSKKPVETLKEQYEASEKYFNDKFGLQFAQEIAELNEKQKLRKIKNNET